MVVKHDAQVAVVTGIDDKASVAKAGFTNQGSDGIPVIRRGEGT